MGGWPSRLRNIRLRHGDSPRRPSPSGIGRARLALLLSLGIAATVGQTFESASPTTSSGGGSASSSGSGSQGSSTSLSGSQSKAAAAALLAAGANQAEHPAPIHGDTWSSGTTATTKASPKIVAPVPPAPMPSATPKPYATTTSPPTPQSSSPSTGSTTTPPARPLNALPAVVNARAAAKRAAGGKTVHGFKQGVSQQVPVLDNATTITYANADGTLTAQVYKDAVNYQNAQGNWLPIDPSLSLQRDGSITAGGGPAGLRIAGSLSDPAVVTMTDGA